ncbi:MAG: sulfatase-like hydrolase/transferase [Planctomycetes bacterium]|nr:sulfatase-like hydrolase/transferase [Planctomycetota bacterium]
MKDRFINFLNTVYYQFITKQTKITALTLGYLLIWYTLLRLGFLLTNHESFRNAGVGDIIQAFIYGLRFDISALLMINGLLIVIYNIPTNPARIKWVRTVLLGLFWVFNLGFITLNLADYGYYPTIHRRLMNEIYTILPDIIRMLPETLLEYYYLVFVLIICAGVFVFASWRLFRKIDGLINYQFNLWREVGCFAGIILLIVLGLRGGLQSRPIRQAHAFFSSNRDVGYLTLNSSFTILRSISQANPGQIKLLPESEAKMLVKIMLRQQNEQMLDEEYPFLRRKTFTAEPRRLNVVIFVMESWTADYVGSVSGAQPSAMPFFDSIAKEGILFTNFLANGQRSVVATTSILTSIPGFFSSSIKSPPRSMIGAQTELNNFLGLGTILHKQGYTTAFLHGAKTGSMGFDAYSKLAGFTHYYGKEDYPNITAQAQDGVWGIWDEEFFLDVARRIDGFQKPFCSIVFSLTSHDPFKIPPHRAALFAKYTNETRFQRVIRYSDYSLQRFFETTKDKSWFKDTIFIITGDHTNYARGNNFHSYFHIPLLIYGPGIIAPQRIDTIGAQVDMMPTILDLLQISTVHSSMGSSLLDNINSHYAVVTDGVQYAIFSERFVLLNDLEKDIALYDYRVDPFLRNDIKSKQPSTAETLRRSLYAYIQEVSGAITNNRICRESDLK